MAGTLVPTSQTTTSLLADSAVVFAAHTLDLANPHVVTATQVGLGSVDNTSDVNKPVSTAQQTALNLKANLSGATFTGGISATNLSGTNTGDQVAAGVSNTPAGSISATTVQTAINELDTEKASDSVVVKLSGAQSIDGVKTFSSPVGVGAATASGDAVQLGYFTPIDNSAASSDISLGVGQSAYVDFTADSSIPLHIATGDKQQYECFLFCTGTAANNTAYLQLNNTTYGTEVSMGQMYRTSSATSGGDFINEGVFRLSIAGTPICVHALFNTAANNETSLISGRDTTGTIGYTYTVSSVWGGATAWTSLGTIACATALTGRVTVRRIA